MTWKNVLITLSIIGYILPNYFVFLESMETGNLLLWLDATETIRQIFRTNITTAFSLDLIWVVLVFFVWLTREAKRLSMKNTYIFYLVTLLFGIAGTFPLFLYYQTLARERSDLT